MLSVVVCAHLPLTRFHSRSVLSVEVESAKRPLGCTEMLFTCFLQHQQVVICCLLAAAHFAVGGKVDAKEHTCGLAGTLGRSIPRLLAKR